MSHFKCGFQLLILLEVLVPLILSNAIPLEEINGGHIGINPVIKPVDPTDVPCYDINNIPYTDRVPNPVNCSAFYKCSPDENNRPRPYWQNCPSTLLFNFDTCDCDWKENATCFDMDNEEHERTFFKCAIPMRDGTFN